MRLLAASLFALVCLLGEPALKAQGVSGTVTTDTLNVRSGPGTDNEVVAQLSRGDLVYAIARQNDWLRVLYLKPEAEAGVSRGWVHAKYIRLGPASTFSACDRDLVTVEVQILNAEMDCKENLFGNGFQDCEITVDYQVLPSCVPDAPVEGEVSCEMTLKTWQGPDDFLPSRKTGRASNWIYVDARSVSGSLTIDIDVSSILQAPPGSRATTSSARPTFTEFFAKASLANRGQLAPFHRERMMSVHHTGTCPPWHRRRCRPSWHRT